MVRNCTCTRLCAVTLKLFNRLATAKLWQPRCDRDIRRAVVAIHLSLLDNRKSQDATTSYRSQNRSK
jgi:hypothetical protein